MTIAACANLVIFINFGYKFYHFYKNTQPTPTTDNENCIATKWSILQTDFEKAAEDNASEDNKMLLRKKKEAFYRAVTNEYFN